MATPKAEKPRTGPRAQAKETGKSRRPGPPGIEVASRRAGRVLARALPIECSPANSERFEQSSRKWRGKGDGYGNRNHHRGGAEPERCGDAPTRLGPGSGRECR